MCSLSELFHSKIKNPGNSACEKLWGKNKNLEEAEFEMAIKYLLIIILRRV